MPYLTLRFWTLPSLLSGPGTLVCTPARPAIGSSARKSFPKLQARRDDSAAQGRTGVTPTPLCVRLVTHFPGGSPARFAHVCSR